MESQHNPWGPWTPESWSEWPGVLLHHSHTSSAQQSSDSSVQWAQDSAAWRLRDSDPPHRSWLHSGAPRLTGALALRDKATRHTLSLLIPLPLLHLACVHGVGVFHWLQTFRLNIFDPTFQAFYFKSEKISLAAAHQLSQSNETEIPAKERHS